MTRLWGTYFMFGFLAIDKNPSKNEDFQNGRLGLNSFSVGIIKGIGC